MGYKLQATKNYSLFTMHPFNRDVRRIAQLKQSMKLHGWIPAYPLHVVRKESGVGLLVKAGHHRLTVGQELGLAAWYVICDDSATVPELELPTNSWKLRDYVDCYVRTESPAHIAVKRYSEETGIGLSQSASLLGGNTADTMGLNYKLKNGTYSVSETTKADVVAKIVTACRELQAPFASHRFFIAALSRMVWIPEFDADVFIHRMAVNIGLAKKQPTMDCYLTLIEEIYNRQSRSKVALAFLAKEAARERSATAKAHAKKLAGK